MIKIERFLLVALVLLFVTGLESLAQRQIENLDRGVVAMRRSSSSVMVGWRWLGTEGDDVLYNVYRGETKLNDTPLNVTNYIDVVSSNEDYSVSAVINGVEQERSEPVTVWTSNYKEISLQVPSGGTVPDGSYSYTPNDASAGDLDGDGQYDIVLKWDPTNAHDNAHSGYTGDVILDAYKLDGTHMWRINLGKNIRAGAHYTQFMVFDFDGDGKSEVACKTAPGTKDGSGSYLSMGPAANDNDAADYRNNSGYILSGPEYLTMFNGETGLEMTTINYNPPRGNVSSWGDSYGNRVDRFLAGVAYLDGERPSLVMARGYYTRAVLAAYDWDGTSLNPRWVFDTNNGYSDYRGQGNHQLSVADVDFDGKDEIVYGSATIDDDGTGLYTTGLHHGDALHVSDMDPDRPGLEVFMPHEDKVNGMTYRAAENGKILYQYKADFDNGRGVAADIYPGKKGYEFWSGAGEGVYNIDKTVIGGKTSMNFAIWWDGDLSRELLDGNRITKYGAGILLNASDCSSNNGSKSTPALSVDILGDWREEVIFRTSDNKKLRIYSSTYPTIHKIRTLMHDPQYRVAIAWQNVAYNQPPHPGFYLGTDMEDPPRAPIIQSDLKWDGTNGSTWDENLSLNWKNNGGSASVFNTGDDVLFTLNGVSDSDIEILGSIQPGKVSVVSPSDYVFSGTGSLTGDMQLLKSGNGKLTINNTNDYTGKSSITQGELHLNGALQNSMVFVAGQGKVSGSGTFGKGLILNAGAYYMPGDKNVEALTTIGDSMKLAGDVSLEIDLSDDPSGATKSNDSIHINGDLIIEGSNRLIISKTDGVLSEGSYTLMTYTGNFVGSTDNVSVEGILEVLYELKVENGTVLLEITKPRDPSSLVWNGANSNQWDLLDTENWKNGNVDDIFVVNDSVLFDDSGVSIVNIVENVPIGGMEVNASQNYTFQGKGKISGEGGITKNGSGYLKMIMRNDFTGPVAIYSGYFEASSIDNSGSASSIGAAGSDPGNWIIDGGIFKYSGFAASTNRGLNIGSAGAILELPQSELSLDGFITGEGHLIKRGAGTLKIFAANTFKGGTVIEDGTIQFTSDNANESGLGSGSIVLKNATLSMYNNAGTYNNASYHIEVPATFNAGLNLDGRCTVSGKLKGLGNLNLYVPYVRSQIDADWSDFEGSVNILTDSDGGLLILNNNNGYANTSINLTNKVTMIREKSENVTIDVGELTGPSTSRLGAGGDGSNTISWRLGTKNTSFSFDGIISNDQYKNSGAQAAIIKAGSGRLTLTAANTYSGGTLVEKGTLIANNATGSATGTGPVIVNSGGALSGTGFIGGDVTIKGGGYLLAGATTTGTFLQVNNNVKFDPGSYFMVAVNSDNGASDKLRSTGTVSLNGTLYINNLGSAFKKGNSFLVIQSAENTGGFSAVYPATPGPDLYWDLSGMSKSGLLRVTDIPTSLEGTRENLNIKAYPNPFADKFYVDISGLQNGCDISVADISGRIVYNATNLKQPTNKIDLSECPKGIYVVAVLYKDNPILKRLIKE